MLDQALFLILILKISTLMIHEDPVKLLFTVLKATRSANTGEETGIDPILIRIWRRIKFVN